MPLIKRDAAGAKDRPHIETAQPLEDLRSGDEEARWKAARALGGDASDLPALATALATERTAHVREALMTAIVRIGGEAGVAALTPYLRSQDAALRTAAIDALQALRGAIPPFVPPLLADEDSDVRILATELARKLPSAEATRLLCDLLARELHPNVCAAAIEVLAEAGTAEAVPTLKACAERFAHSPFLPFAASIAIAALSRTKISAGMSVPETPGALAPKVTPEDVRRLCEFLYRRSGMLFDESKRYYIDRRLVERIKATESASFQSYFAMLRADADHEIEQLINAFTINETYFNREDHQFRCMTSSLLDEILLRKRPADPIRIWSIPCATGEEPYSIAMWLMEHWDAVDRYNIEIFGSDIDTRALKAAVEGVYGTRALMRLPADIVERYFERLDDGQVRIDQGLRDSITFTPANLIDSKDMALYRDFDIVFCRNVLIYFDDTSRRIAAENLYDCLRPGGYICLGHSETMSRISPLFKVCRYPDAIVYRRPEENSDGS